MKSLLSTMCLLAVYNLTLAQPGNVGIGTENPTAKLEVNGSFKANGTTVLQDSVYVNGPAYLQNGLSVVNGATIQNGITVHDQAQLNGYVTIANGMSVTGLATMNSGLTVTGGLQNYGHISSSTGSISDNFNVNGLATITQLTVLSGITAPGANFSGSVSTGGLFPTNINASGQIQCPTLSTGPLYAGVTNLSSLQVTGNTTFNSLLVNNANITSNLTIGNSLLNSIGLFFPSLQSNRRINLWGTGSEHQYIGFGNTSNTLRYQVATLGDSHIFYAGIDQASSQELMRIHGSGNVGLGVSSSSNRLDVSIGGRYGDHPVGLPLYVTSDCGASASGAEFRHLNGTQGIGLGYNTIYTAGSWIDQDLGLKTNGTGDIIFINDETETMRLVDDGNLYLLGNIQNEDFSAPELQNGYYNYGSSFATAAYFKDKVGIVHLRGLVQIGVDPDNLVIFTLPVGYRPSTSGRLIFSGLNNDATCRIDVFADGSVIVTNGNSGWINLSEVQFRAD